jgi:2-keto-3-deoxy-6-phosphogluconate aldolase
MMSSSVRSEVTEIIARISEIGIVPVIVLDDPGLARPLADALAEGGCRARR